MCMEMTPGLRKGDLDAVRHSAAAPHVTHSGGVKPFRLTAGDRFRDNLRPGCCCCAALGEKVLAEEVSADRKGKEYCN